MLPPFLLVFDRILPARRYASAVLAALSPLMTLKVTFAVRNLAISHTSGNTACTVYNMFTH